MKRVEAKPVRFTRGSRKHRIGRASARRVIDTVTPTVEIDDVTQAVIIWWVGDDERGRSWKLWPSSAPTVGSSSM